jgi:hypothetical protein
MNNLNLNLNSLPSFDTVIDTISIWNNVYDFSSKSFKRFRDVEGNFKIYNIDKKTNLFDELKSELLVSCRYVNINLYCNQSVETSNLPLHKDVTDILVVQLSGEKKWTYFEGGVEHVVHLRRGNSLFLKNGVYHEAISTEGNSAHLAIAIYEKNAYFLKKIISSKIDKIFAVSPSDDVHSLANNVSRYFSRDNISNELELDLEKYFSRIAENGDPIESLMIDKVSDHE